MTDQRAPASETLDAAIIYAAIYGWRVVPILPGAKRPAVNDWVNAATTDPQLITQWWTAHPSHGVGIVTGHGSGLFVLDVDISDGKEGDETLADLEAQHGPLPDTVEVVTGSGGRHLYFQYPTDLDLTTNAGALGPGLDIRADGGQVVAPPTRHPNGQPYAWELEHDPHDGIELAPPPNWLTALLTAPTGRPDRTQPAAPYTGPERPGDRYNHETRWADLLEADGATYLGTRNDRNGNQYELWARPGTDHTSATLGWGGTELLKIHTTNWPGLTSGETYSRFAYYTATRHAGDHTAAARQLALEHRARTNPDEPPPLRTEEPPWPEDHDMPWHDDPPAPDFETDPLLEPAIEITPTGDTPPVVAADEAPRLHPDNPIPSMRVDWTELFTTDMQTSDWLIEPLIARGRGHAIYAPAKAGKSFMLLDVCAHAATGRPTLHRAETDPITVVYIDYEMTNADLVERLESLGFDETTNLERFHYILASGIPPLDRKEGGAWLLNYCRYVGAQFVALDTFARAIEGEENDSDTIRDFYRHTGGRLKAAGIAWARLDNTGKDASKGARGSSGKNDDVDIVWKLMRTEHGVQLTRTHARMQWVPERIDLAAGGDPFKHRIGAKDWPAGTQAMADELDAQGIAADLSIRQAKAVLRERGISFKNMILEAAIRYRRSGGTPGGTRGGTGKTDTGGTRQGTPTKTPKNIEGDAPGDAGGRDARERGTQPPPLKGGLDPHATNQPDDDPTAGFWPDHEDEPY